MGAILHYQTEGKGTGLGMGICRRIVEEHGGTIVIESELERGSTVQILPPLNKNLARNERSSPAVAPGAA